jgi:23S rRNA (cytidine1920-2'-O)/16S rRNA (cytidine1409-2'-O)-methyltransferase
MKKQRLDKLLVDRGMVASRSLAQRLISAGEVTVQGQVADKPGTTFTTDVNVELRAQPRFVSRGGEKLDAVLQKFAIEVENCVVADIGASTGGFTDCLLQRGAGKVYAIDVGYGQLAWKLRQDPKVVVLERTNARYLDSLPEKVDLIVSDVSFISLRLIYAAAVHWLKPGGMVISLVKPQFEAGPQYVGKGGVVRDSAIHQDVLVKVVEDMAHLNLHLQHLMVSPLKGPAGNIEFLGVWMLTDERTDSSITPISLSPEEEEARFDNLIAEALLQATRL